MSRLRRIANHDRIFFVTTNLAPDVSPLTAEERDAILSQISRQHAAGDFLLFSYVVMPDHLHLLIAPNQDGLVASMHRLKRRSALEIAIRRRVRNAFWQARYFDFVLRRAGDFWNKLAYIHENPVKAGLASQADDWRWSSAAHYAGNRKSKVMIDSVRLPADRNTWLYRAPQR